MNEWPTCISAKEVSVRGSILWLNNNNNNNNLIMKQYEAFGKMGAVVDVFNIDSYMYLVVPIVL